MKIDRNLKPRPVQVTLLLFKYSYILPLAATFAFLDAFANAFTFTVDVVAAASYML